MRFGLQWFATDETLLPSELAPMVEERGFESLFVTEHTHIPVSRRSPRPDGCLDLPREYLRTLDPFVALAAMAVTSTRLMLGTGILLVAQHDPLIAAKAIASVDHLAKGRVLFGVGAGWNVEEAEDHGIAGPARFEIMREHIEAIRALWSMEEAHYAGQHVSFGPSWSWPKPKRPPPVLMGGNGLRALDRVVAIADEWAPTDEGPERMLERLATLRQRCNAAGRDPIPTTLFAPVTDLASLGRYEDLGVHRVVLKLPSLSDRGQMERRLDDLAAVVATYGRTETSRSHA